MSKTNVHGSLPTISFLCRTTVLITFFNLSCVFAELITNTESSRTSNRLVNNLKQIKSEYVLDTPFFVYEWLSFPDAILSDQKGTTISYDDYFQSLNIRKHSDDYWFMRSALNHPMRVKDPKKG